jgi:hypothetical protein
MSTSEAVIASLERAAETCDDLSPAVYQRFAERCPETFELMTHTDDYMRGRMMNDVLTMVMTPAEDMDAGYLNFEIRSHRAYGVTAEMFRPLLEIVRDTVREELGDGWQEAHQTAWEERIGAITRRIEAVPDEAAAAPPRSL